MTADHPDDFPYTPVRETEDADLRQGYWRVAEGLQRVDGLDTSPYLKHLASEHVAGKRGIAETGELLRAYYRSRKDKAASDGHPNAAGPGAGLNTHEAPPSPALVASAPLGAPTTTPDSHASRVDAQHREADLVSQRIVELLSSGAFLLAPSMLPHIHRTLFQDLDEGTYQPGRFKQEALQKQEFVLNGDSVVYADPTLVERALEFAFDDERAYLYGAAFERPQIENLSRFVSRIWQVHPFVEGNTRTVAAFTILYLRDLGFDIDNNPFENHARYFRDALVRANYRNAKAGVMPDLSFLVRFFENVLIGAAHGLRPRDLMAQPLFDDPSLLRNIAPSLALNQAAASGTERPDYA